MTQEWKAAVQRGSLDELERLAAAGADIDARDAHAQTALMLAAVDGHADVVDWLVARGAMLDLKAPDLFLHNHPQNLGRALNPALPVNSRCVFCLDADAWREMVKSAEARFQAMLREAK